MAHAVWPFSKKRTSSATPNNAPPHNQKSFLPGALEIRATRVVRSNEKRIAPPGATAIKSLFASFSSEKEGFLFFSEEKNQKTFSFQRNADDPGLGRRGMCRLASFVGFGQCPQPAMPGFQAVVVLLLFLRK